LSFQAILVQTLNIICKTANEKNYLKEKYIMNMDTTPTMKTTGVISPAY